MLTRGLDKVYVGVVGDDESHRRALARLLRAAGMQPVAYASAEEFCADMKRLQFACHVVDIELPGMSGVDLRNRLATDGIATRVFFVTAHDGPRVREQAMAGRVCGLFSQDRCLQRDPRRDSPCVFIACHQAMMRRRQTSRSQSRCLLRPPSLAAPLRPGSDPQQTGTASTRMGRLQA